MGKIFVLGKMFGIVVVAAFLGVALLIAAHSLPRDKIIDNVRSSLAIYNAEGQEPRWADIRLPSKVDNFTDVIMLMKATYPVEDLTRSILLTPSWHLVDGSPIKTLTLAMENPEPESESVVWNYPQYWHGYLAILKPALMFAPVYDLRLLNFYAQMFLITTAMILIYRRLGLLEMYAFLLVVAVINPVTTAMNFQNSDIFYIVLLSTIFILLRNEFLLRGQNYLYFFLIIGIVTAYFDFLTYPVTDLGIPLCVCVLMNRKFFFTAELKKVAQKLSSYLFAWGFGYGGMWFAKWCLAACIVDNFIYVSLLNAQYRASSFTALSEGGIQFTAFDVIDKNLDALLGGPFSIVLLLTAIGIICLLVVQRQKFYVTKSMVLSFAVIILLPFAWYAVLKNHSYVHPFLEYRNLSIALFGLTCFFSESLRGLENNE